MRFGLTPPTDAVAAKCFFRALNCANFAPCGTSRCAFALIGSSSADYNSNSVFLGARFACGMGIRRECDFPRPMTHGTRAGRIIDADELKHLLDESAAAVGIPADACSIERLVRPGFATSSGYVCRRGECARRPEVRSRGEDGNEAEV